MLGISLGMELKQRGSGVPTSAFYAPLTKSLVLTRGTGDPTFTRAIVDGTCGLYPVVGIEVNACVDRNGSIVGDALEHDRLSARSHTDICVVAVGAVTVVFRFVCGEGHDICCYTLNP